MKMSNCISHLTFLHRFRIIWIISIVWGHWTVLHIGSRCNHLHRTSSRGGLHSFTGGSQDQRILNLRCQTWKHTDGRMVEWCFICLMQMHSECIGDVPANRPPSSLLAIFISRVCNLQPTLKELEALPCSPSTYHNIKDTISSCLKHFSGWIWKLLLILCLQKRYLYTS